MERIKIDDLYQLKFLSDINMSPDGKYASFTIANCDYAENKYKMGIWLADLTTNEIRRLTNNGDERTCLWLDNENILFASVRGKKKADTTVYWKLNIHGGEAVKAFTVPARVLSIKKITGDKYAMTCRTYPEGKDPVVPQRAQAGKDYLIFDEIPFWMNGQGVRNKTRNTVMIFDAATGELTRVADPYQNCEHLSVSPDKTKLMYSGPIFQNKQDVLTGLYLYDIATAKTTTLVEPGTFAIGPSAFFGDKILFAGTTWEWHGRNPKLYTLDPATGKYELFKELDCMIGLTIGSDAKYGAVSMTRSTPDKYYFVKSDWGNSNIVSIDHEGNVEKYTDSEKYMGSVLAFDVKGDKAVFLGMRNTRPAEVYTLDLKTGVETQISHINTEYADTHSIVVPEYFRFTNSDGYELDGYVIKPADYVPGKKYPGVLEIHGGPKAISGGVFQHEFQTLANAGYFVFYTNPRGSDGRGEEFANVTAKIGTIDYQDLMELTDEVLKRYPDIDEKKLGLCGGSYGGFMCNWVAGHSDRFAAAASQRCISNYLTKILTPDNGFTHNMSQMGEKDIWGDFDNVWNTSPLKYVENVKIPMLFIQSDEDYRCWMVEPLQFFTSLRRNNIPSKICLYHGENHELSRSGKPRNRVSRLTEIVNWFETYLKD